MERLKIFVGLAAIAGVVFLFGERGGDEEATAAKAVQRGFASDTTSARFVTATPRE